MKAASLVTHRKNERGIQERSRCPRSGMKLLCECKGAEGTRSTVSNPKKVRDFVWVESRPGNHVMLSRAAGMLALYAAAASMRRNTPGFIPDERLGSDTTLPALELVVSGLWRRVEGGYEIAGAWSTA